MARMKILQNLEIEGVAAEGKCVARVDNKVVFVQRTAPGDIVDVRIIKKKKNFLEAVPIKFHKYSEDRVEPFCDHFDLCGGCKWQHMPYKHQLGFKQQQVIDSLERIAKVDLPTIGEIIPSEKTSFYRNKLEYTFCNQRWLTTEEIKSEEDIERNGLGFHMPGRFDKILEIDHCHLQPDPSNAIRNGVEDFAHKNSYTFYDLVNHTGYLRNIIIRTANTGQVMVILQVAQDDPKLLTPIMDYLRDNFEITSLNYIINTKLNETYGDLKAHNYAGAEWIIEEMPLGDDSEKILKFKIGPKSFYQTNSQQAYTLYKKTREFAGLTGAETVYDLYTGTGTIANFVAHKAKNVVGIEYVEEATRDAVINSQMNGVSNTSFFAGDMKDMLTDEFVGEHGNPDVVITDPPRAGMHPDVVKMLLSIKANKVVYVSCNPATQARDLAMMDDLYKVTKVQAVDMFPHTHHVENIVLLELR